MYLRSDSEVDVLLKGRTSGWALSFWQWNQAEPPSAPHPVCGASGSRLEIYIRHSSAFTLVTVIGPSQTNFKPKICRRLQRGGSRRA